MKYKEPVTPVTGSCICKGNVLQYEKKGDVP